MSIIGADASAQSLPTDHLVCAQRLVAGMPFTDLNHLLRTRAERTPERVAYHFSLDGDQFGEAITYGALDSRARAVAGLLLQHGRPGDRVLLLDGGRAFLCALFGCLYAGMVAVCADLPRAGRPLTRLSRILCDAEPRIALGMAGATPQRPDLTALLAEWDCMPLSTNDAPVRPPTQPVFHPGPDALAWLQYTSGSVGDPKGVMVDHGNVLATLLDLDRAWRHGSDSCMVSWLPVFHDMGLVYGVLQPLYNGFPCYLMSPMSFLQQPTRWLHAISRFGATHCAAPNFAFRLCVETANPERLSRLDLRTVRVLLNGAEPLHDEVLRRFTQTFAPCGLDPDALCPGYGLAEATLKVSTKPRGAAIRRLAVDPQALERGRVIERPQAEGGRVLVGHGHSDIEAGIEIVDPHTLRRCAPGQIGEIWVTSASVARGYWRRPRETAEAFQARLGEADEGPFLRTGDLGFFDRGDLFITGRLKDVIVIFGRNHYPQDIERTVQACDAALRPDHGAAFAIDTGEGEELVIVQEVRRSVWRDLDAQRVVGHIREAVAQVHDLNVSAVALIAPGTIARTTSGKIQRAACRNGYLCGTLSLVHRSSRPCNAPSVRA